MKKSQRYIRATLIGLIALVVAFIIANRFVEPPRGDGWPVASTPAELAALRDFSELSIGGDFDVTVEQGSDFRVSFMPTDRLRSMFRAKQLGDTLFLEGYGHRSETGAAQVHVVLPALRELSVESGNGAELTVSGVTTPARVTVSSARMLRLVNNSGALQVRARGVQNIVQDAVSAASSTMTIISGGTQVTAGDVPGP